MKQDFSLELNKAFILVIVTPLMLRVHEKVNVNAIGGLALHANFELQSRIGSYYKRRDVRESLFVKRSLSIQNMVHTKSCLFKWFFNFPIITLIV